MLLYMHISLHIYVYIHIYIYIYLYTHTQVESYKLIIHTLIFSTSNQYNENFTVETPVVHFRVKGKDISTFHLFDMFNMFSISTFQFPNCSLTM